MSLDPWEILCQNLSVWLQNFFTDAWKVCCWNLFQLYGQENFCNISCHWRCSIVYSWQIYAWVTLCFTVLQPTRYDQISVLTNSDLKLDSTIFYMSIKILLKARVLWKISNLIFRSIIRTAVFSKTKKITIAHEKNKLRVNFKSFLNRTSLNQWPLQLSGFFL